MKHLILFLTPLMMLLHVSCVTRNRLTQAEKKNIEIGDALSQVDRENVRLRDSLSGFRLQVSELNKTNTACVNDLLNAQKEKQLANQRFSELSWCLQEQGDTLQAIKRKALQEFSKLDNTSVEVTYRNGMVYISLQDPFMFKSGSTRINTAGKKALAVIAQILSENNGITAIVVGNTDSVQIARGYKDNWTLSTERANAIVRYLLSQYGSDPTRLIAAGKSRFSPVASNDDEPGRAKNRRTDIIINPNLNKLWLLSQKYP